MDGLHGVLDFFFASFERLLTADEDPVTSIGENIPLPRFTAADIGLLLMAARERFRLQPTVLMISHPVYIVGDVHGNLQDLLRIFRAYGLTSTYLFLGDYVDRGQFSLECILFLFALTCRWPERFFLIRGNHECQAVSSMYGFRDEIIASYPATLFQDFVGVFQWMPLAAVVDGSIFCVHGGISTELHNLDQLRALVRPIEPVVADSLVWGLLWNDPSLVHPGFSDSVLGGRMTFGTTVIHNFLTANGLKAIVRGHQCVDGVQEISAMNIVTVFSSSNYGERANRCGVLFIAEDGQMFPKIFGQVITPIQRSDLSFLPVQRPERGGVTTSVLNAMRITLNKSTASLATIMGPKRRLGHDNARNFRTESFTSLTGLTSLIQAAQTPA
jgi:diadenosine tetraphosphatase ApaH/serine/threonine PP2A family protein phosphatase